MNGSNISEYCARSVSWNSSLFGDGKPFVTVPCSLLVTKLSAMPLVDLDTNGKKRIQSKSSSSLIPIPSAAELWPATPFGVLLIAIPSSWLPVCEVSFVGSDFRSLSKPNIMTLADAHILCNSFAAISRMSKSSFADLLRCWIRQACKSAMKAVAECQHVMAMRKRELPRARMSLRILAVHDAARIAGGKAWGNWPPERFRCRIMMVVR